ncbi:MAG TPA: DUF1552 domain-containing protein [Bdellovibrionales bacterium]|nr:DUF1552 domain-containing protein [Bdellovibrionales bacterium]
MSDGINNRYFGRRQFLMGVGGHFLMLPVLTSMLPRALAQAVQANRRLALFPMEYGMHTKYLRPDLATVASLMKTHKSGIKYASLASLPKPVSFVVDSSYSDLLSQMNLFRGLDFMQETVHTHGVFAGVPEFVSDGHNNRIPVCGKTIDVIVEQSPAFKASFAGQLPTMRMSAGIVQYSATDSTMSVDRAADGTPLPQPFLQGDENAFNKIFGGLIVPSGGTPIEQRKLLVVDSIREDLGNLKNHRRISSEDKLMLDRFITGIDDLQRNLKRTATVCSKPSSDFQLKAGARTTPETSKPEKYYDNIFEMATLAFACDQSRMLMVMNSLAGNLFSQRFQHHAEDDINNEGTDGQSWYIKQIAKFARKLQGFPDPSGNGSLLDNSLLIMINEHSERRSHSGRDLPVVTFGKLGGTVTAGNFIQYVHRQSTRNGTVTDWGYAMKQLLVSAMAGMGVQKSQYIKEGDANGFGYWGSYAETNYSAIKGIANDPLPFFTSGT